MLRRSKWRRGSFARGSFAFEFVEGNTLTRVYFMRLRRLTQEALSVGRFTAELQRARAENVPTFTHFLDLPVLFLIVSLGALKPESWASFVVGSLLALAVATALTIVIPRIYQWAGQQ